MWLVSFIKVNKDSIIISSIFLVLGIIIPLLITKKKNDIPISNNTSIKNVIYIIQQQLIQINIYNSQNNNENLIEKSSVNGNFQTKQISNKQPLQISHIQNSSPSNSTNDDLCLFLFVSFIAVSAYYKFHSQIMHGFAMLTLFSFVSITTLTIMLYKNDNLDKLNQLWISIMMLLIVSDIITVFFMSHQPTVINGDINILLKGFYYLVGFISMVIPNIFMLILLIHIFALNSFLVKQSKISEFILRKTHFFVYEPKRQITLIIFFTIFSLCFTSGLSFSFVEKLIEINNNNTDIFLNSTGM
ncbi:hypothetical protein [Tepidibacter sp. Z1-5]|uniref:hypothetical protein n=1 Tax=Tepidibacter sp. Z1-5 TaxID=3134138 RepID=UPI0030C067FC